MYKELILSSNYDKKTNYYNSQAEISNYYYFYILIILQDKKYSF